MTEPKILDEGGSLRLVGDTSTGAGVGWPEVDYKLTGDIKRDLTYVIGQEHPGRFGPGSTCINTCDIHAALNQGHPYVAAALLASATETPVLGVLADHYDINLSDLLGQPGFAEFREYSRAKPKCDECGSTIYGRGPCYNCHGHPEGNVIDPADLYSYGERRAEQARAVRGARAGQEDS